MSEVSGVRKSPVRRWLHHVTGGHVRLSIVVMVALALTLTAADVVALGVAMPNALFGHRYYLALGDSISFGYQPDFDFTSGFVDDVFSDLRKANITDLVNYACAGETSTTMIAGDCIGHLIHHNAYTGPQLDAALSFLRRHAGAVTPVTLDIGSNDVLPDWDSRTCSSSSSGEQDLKTLDTNLTRTILPALKSALGAHYQSGDLVLLNYYNPFIRECPDSALFVEEVNSHLAEDARPFGIPVADVYAAFGGHDHMADHICDYTWICDEHYHDIHPTTAGYRVIAKAVEDVLGYPGPVPSVPSFPRIPFLGAVAPSVSARRTL